MFFKIKSICLVLMRNLQWLWNLTTKWPKNSTEPRLFYYTSCPAPMKGATRRTFQNADKNTSARDGFKLYTIGPTTKSCNKTALLCNGRQNPAKCIFSIHLGMGITKTLLLFSAGKINSFRKRQPNNNWVRVS